MLCIIAVGQVGIDAGQSARDNLTGCRVDFDNSERDREKLEKIKIFNYVCIILVVRSLAFR